MPLLNGDFHPVGHLKNNICKTASWAVYSLFHYLIYLYANRNSSSFLLSLFLSSSTLNSWLCFVLSRFYLHFLKNGISRINYRLIIDKASTDAKEECSVPKRGFSNRYLCNITDIYTFNIQLSEINQCLSSIWCFMWYHKLLQKISISSQSISITNMHIC